MPILVSFGVGIALVVAILAVTGYAPFLFQSPIPHTPDYDNSLITLKRTPCYGYCPNYSLAIHGNGTVLYEGRSFVKERGNHTYSIPKENVSELVDEFYAAGFFSMPDDYGGCDDCPTYVAFISADGTSKSVIYNDIFASDKLRLLDKRIDELAGTGQFVKCINEKFCMK